MAARAFFQAALAAVLCGLTVMAGAAPVPAASQPLAARVDGSPLYAFTVDTMWRQRRSAKPGAERRAVLDGLVLQRLLVARANAAAPREDKGLSVAFAADVLVEDRLVATLREVYGREIDAAVKALPGGTLDSLVSAVPPMPPARLEAIFGAPGPMALEIALSEAQQAQAVLVEVLRYQLPGAAPARVTLFDVYRRQNVQGRLALSRQPAAYAVQQARQLLAGAFVLHWAGQRFGADAVADLRQAIAEGESTLALQNLHGIGLDTDAGSPLLNRMAGEATREEIEKFYYQHKDMFARIEKVRARHIRLRDEAQAKRVLQSLQGGADFAATARSVSLAPDAANGGDLGWISADDSKDWLASLVFSQQPGKPSAPVRAPVGPNQAAFWEIVLVEQRVHGVHPLDSETVRYQASRGIAIKRAMQQFGEMMEQARSTGQVEILEAQ